MAHAHSEGDPPRRAAAMEAEQELVSTKVFNSVVMYTPRGGGSAEDMKHNYREEIQRRPGLAASARDATQKSRRSTPRWRVKAWLEAAARSRRARRVRGGDRGEGGGQEEKAESSRTRGCRCPRGPIDVLFMLILPKSRTSAPSGCFAQYRSTCFGVCDWPSLLPLVVKADNRGRRRRLAHRARGKKVRRRASACQGGPAGQEPQAAFIPIKTAKAGMIFKCGVHGPGYYLTAQEKERSNRSNATDEEPPASASSDGTTGATGGAPANNNNRFRAAAAARPPPGQGSSTNNGMPSDLPEDAARALGKRLDRNGVTRELAVPLGGGWMQRAGRGSFQTGVDSGSGFECIEVSSVEPLFYLLTLDQNPDAHVVQTAHYKLETTFRCPFGANGQVCAIVLDWRRTRSTITAPCFTGVVLSGTTWRLEQYAEGQKRTLAEVHDAGLKAGTASALSMAAPWQKVVVEVRGDRVHVTCNKRLLFGSFTIPPPPDTSLANGRGNGRASALTGAVGFTTYKSRVQIKSFEFVPIEREGHSASLSADGGNGGELRTPRPPFTGGEPKLVELIEETMLDHSPQVEWEVIGGLAQAKRLLNEAVVLPLLIPEYFAAASCRSTWKGVLLFGPPGTGKTLLARAVASLGKTAFFNVSASSLVSHYHGESEKLVRTLFALARHHAPSVVFFDEVDALVSSRGMAGEHEASRRLKSELLMQMDGVSSHGNGVGKDSLVMVLATSNKPWDLDEALRRRLERRIYIPLPDEASRKEMLSIHLKGVKLASDAHGGFRQAHRGLQRRRRYFACRDASMMPMRKAVEGAPQGVQLHAGLLEGEVATIPRARAAAIRSRR